MDAVASPVFDAFLESAPTLRLSLAALVLESVPDDLLRETLNEATIRTLWADAQKAFPRTRRRQHVIDRVRTETVKWQAFPGQRLLIGSARVLGERYPDKARKRYRSHVMFREVKFHEEPRKGSLKITTYGASPTHPRPIYFEKLSMNSNVAVRCNCPDHVYRFNWECSDQRALFGPKAPPYTPPNPDKYRGPANPSGLAGLCKHIMNCALALYKANAILLN